MADKKAFFPSDWDDDQTMNVLFAPFRENRDINPHSWDKKLKFWTEMIVEDARYAKEPCFDVEELPHRFTRNDRVPVCLDIVLRDMKRIKKICTLQELQAQGKSSWLSWGFGMLVKKPVSWTWSKVFGSGDNLDEEYIVVEVLQDMAKAVLNRHYTKQHSGSVPHIIPFPQLQQMCKDICSSPRSLQLVLLQLELDGKASVITENNQQLVHFAKKNADSVQPLTKVDKETMKLQNTEVSLVKQIEEIDEETERCRQEAKVYLSKSQRTAAKNCLRRKQTLTRMREKREIALETIHHMIERIRDAESNKMVLDAYEAGTHIYKQLASSHGLQTDNIDDIMANVHETFDMQAEIDDSLAHNPFESSLDVTTADLEAELNEILAGEESDEEITPGVKDVRINDPDADFDLPAVPRFDPATPPRPVGFSPPRPASASNPSASSRRAEPPKQDKLSRLKQELLAS